MTDTTSTTAAAQPSTTEILAALAQSLLPLAGPEGIAIDTAMTAGLQLLSTFQAQRAAGATVMTMVDLEAAASKTTTDLAQLATDVAGQGGQS